MSMLLELGHRYTMHAMRTDMPFLQMLILAMHGCCQLKRKLVGKSTQWSSQLK